MCVTVIARRSSRHEVEHEQMMHHPSGGVSSLVTMRGACTVFTTMMERQQVLLAARADQRLTAAQYPDEEDEEELLQEEQRILAPTRDHLQLLRSRYASPVIVLNLMTQHRPIHTSTKMEHKQCRLLAAAVDHLNSRLGSSSSSANAAEEEKLTYVSYDVADHQQQNHSIAQDLNTIAGTLVRGTGLFSHTPARVFRQEGIVRMNCFDCVSSSNTAQWVIGLNAARHQLKRIGKLDTPKGNELFVRLRLALDSLYTQLGTRMVPTRNSQPHTRPLFHDADLLCVPSSFFRPSNRLRSLA